MCWSAGLLCSGHHRTCLGTVKPASCKHTTRKGRGKWVFWLWQGDKADVSQKTFLYIFFDNTQNILALKVHTEHSIPQTRSFERTGSISTLYQILSYILVRKLLEQFCSVKKLFLTIVKELGMNDANVKVP